MKFQRATTFLLLALLAAASAPFVAAHGGENAAETEVHLLEDEGDDSFYFTGGFDIYQVFLGEAHFPGLGVGSAGDAVYFRTILYGNYAQRPANAEEFRVVFRFSTPAGDVERFVATTDGKTLTTDFDHLEYELTADELVIERAGILFTNLSISPGDTINGFIVESSVDGDLRDRAPGGLFVPGSGGRVEVPAELYPVPGAGVITESVVLSGPVKYALATVTPRVDARNVVDVAMTSLLTEGAQHAHVEVTGGSWKATPLGNATGGEIKAGETLTVGLTLAPGVEPGEEVVPGRLDVYTDLGGRVSYILTWENGAPLVVPEGGEVPINILEMVPVAETPGIGILPLIAGLGALALVARRRS